jgi:hypothetical protein
MPRTLSKRSLAEGKINAGKVPPVILVVVPSGYERVFKAGKQVIHLERTKRYMFAQPNVDPTTDGHRK